MNGAKLKKKIGMTLPYILTRFGRIAYQFRKITQFFKKNFGMTLPYISSLVCALSLLKQQYAEYKIFISTINKQH